MKRILFVQPFGLFDPGGGAKILRSLIKNAPFFPISVATGVSRPFPNKVNEELWVPIRPKVPFIEHTRLNRLTRLIEPLFYYTFYRKILKTIRVKNTDAIHITPHQHFDFWLTYKAAKKEGKEIFLSIHDDFRCQEKIEGKKEPGSFELKEVWNNSTYRFVISKEMGEEYCKRYGLQEYSIISDGVEEMPTITPVDGQRFHFYFCGLVHFSYQPNFKCFFEVLNELNRTSPCAFVMRGGILNNEISNIFAPLVLPFASDKEVNEDKALANFLYLPLPFDPKYSFFNKFSLSTKFIQYLRFGLPILYHGPKDTALYNVLNTYDAAIMITEVDPEQVLKILSSIKMQQINRVLSNLQTLINERYLLRDIRDRFLYHIGVSTTQISK